MGFLGRSDHDVLVNVWSISFYLALTTVRARGMGVSPGPHSLETGSQTDHKQQHMITARFCNSLNLHRGMELSRTVYARCARLSHALPFCQGTRHVLLKRHQLLARLAFFLQGLQGFNASDRFRILGDEGGPETVHCIVITFSAENTHVGHPTCWNVHAEPPLDCEHVHSCDPAFHACEHVVRDVLSKVLDMVVVVGGGAGGGGGVVVMVYV